MDLFTLESGSAARPAIVFLHGGGGGGWMWQHQLAALSDQFYCLAPDLPEHGQSSAVKPFSITDSAARIAELIRARVPGGRAHVVGLSEGAQIGVALLSQAPEVVERAILSTMDIKHENFGWMLCWGDAAWVPFTYTLQAMYLVGHPFELPIWAVVGIVALNFGGYYVFRSVNLQKDRFRADPEKPIWGAKPQYIQTRRGTLLLTSGWWGKARHANYMGDLMMALAWCLPCAFGSIFPYFYFIYFTWLLVHREWRDDKMCAAKYGEDWTTYRNQVRWRIVPGIY